MRKLVVALLAVLLGGAMALAVPQLVQARPAGGTGPTGTLTGKVVDSSGNPVSGAIVRVMRIPGSAGHRHGRPQRPQPGQTIWHKNVFGVTKTADDGTFTVNNAPVGKYRVFVFDRGVGFGHIKRPVAVASGGTANAGTITLQKARRGRGRPPRR
ncbi:MAG: carboxypeptidase-like regulatory domain-containing protein [Phycisphaerae bacterium]